LSGTRAALWMTAVAWLVTVFASVAHAASRVVFELADPAVEVVLDHGPVRPMGAPNRRTAHHVTAGSHVVIIQKGGQELSRSTLQVPDGASVVVRVDPAGQLQVSGATATSAAPAGQSGGISHAPPPPPPQADAAPPSDGAPPKGAGASALSAATESDQLQPDPTADSFDMNEGNGRANTYGDDGPAGDYGSWSRTVGTAGRVVGGVVAPGVGGAVGTVAPAAAHGAANVVRNAESGGVSALSGGSTFRQGRPIPKKTDTGYVVFECPTGDNIVVYLEGFVIAQVGPGAQKAKTKLEVGRHKLEFMDADTGQYIYRGVADVEKDQTLTLEIGDATPPKALDRTWAWSAR